MSVEKGEKAYAMFVVETPSGARIVLGNPNEGGVGIVKALMKPLQERESKLAYGA